MKKIAKLTLLGLLVTTAGTLRADDTDFQIWLTGNLSGKLTTNYTISINQEAYYTDDASELTYYHAQTMISRPITDWLGAGAGYRRVNSETAGDWKKEDRWLLDLTPKAKVAGWSLVDRNRFEFRAIEGSAQDIIFRYRNRLTATPPVKFGEWNTSPYLEDEFFIDEVREQITENRFYLGLASTPVDNLKTKLYGMWQAKKGTDDWADAAVLGISADLAF